MLKLVIMPSFSLSKYISRIIWLQQNNIYIYISLSSLSQFVTNFTQEILQWLQRRCSCRTGKWYSPAFISKSKNHTITEFAVLRFFSSFWKLQKLILYLVWVFYTDFSPCYCQTANKAFSHGKNQTHAPRSSSLPCCIRMVIFPFHETYGILLIGHARQGRRRTPAAYANKKIFFWN